MPDEPKSEPAIPAPERSRPMLAQVESLSELRQLLEGVTRQSAGIVARLRAVQAILGRLEAALDAWLPLLRGETPPAAEYPPASPQGVPPPAPPAAAREPSQGTRKPGMGRRWGRKGGDGPLLTTRVLDAMRAGGRPMNGAQIAAAVWKGQKADGCLQRFTERVRDILNAQRDVIRVGTRSQTKYRLRGETA